ncbi:MAG: hypothetical protein KBT27_07255 [Prevotellaceae bacterium]|nr:hypothetical protein [Candidatus Faecinaster equi]
MKKLFLFFLSTISSLSVFAQIAEQDSISTINQVQQTTSQNLPIPEPEFADQSLVIIDGQGILIPRESAYVTSKANATMYIFGMGKVKTQLRLDGTKSNFIIEKKPQLYFIIRTKDNVTDPESFINICPLKVLRNFRYFQLGKLGTFSGAREDMVASVDYNAKKYGESSYYIMVEDLEPGEYGILIGDPNSFNEKNKYKIATFSIQ